MRSSTFSRPMWSRSVGPPGDLFQFVVEPGNRCRCRIIGGDLHIGIVAPRLLHDPGELRVAERVPPVGFDRGGHFEASAPACGRSNRGACGGLLQRRRAFGFRPMAAAAAVTGHLTDVRTLPRN